MKWIKNLFAKHANNSFPLPQKRPPSPKEQEKILKYLRTCNTPFLEHDADAKEALFSICYTAFRNLNEFCTLAEEKGWDKDVFNLVSRNGNPLLHLISGYNLQMGYGVGDTKKLIKNGARVNSLNSLGNTPLQDVLRIHHKNDAYFKNIDIIHLLINKSEDCINSQNKEGDTALHTAIKIGDMDIIKRLLLKEASPDIANNAGEKPSDSLNNFQVMPANFEIHLN